MWLASWSRWGSRSGIGLVFATSTLSWTAPSQCFRPLQSAKFTTSYSKLVGPATLHKAIQILVSTLNISSDQICTLPTMRQKTMKSWKQWRIQEGCSRSKTEGCHKRVWKDWKELLEMLARS
ncbi:hypothetical protein PHAVU_004G087250 [Phaseolus vulgaris]